MFTMPSMNFLQGGGVDLRSAELQRASSEVISCAHQASISLSTDLSMMFWMYLNSAVPSGDIMTLCSKQAALLANDGWAAYLQDDGFGGRSLFWTTGNGAGAQQQVGWGYTPPTGTWIHVALTYDVSQTQVNEAKLYLDTVSQGLPGIVTAGDFSSIGTNTAPLKWGGLSGHHFDGLLCELRLFNRVLPPAEIAADYNKIIADNAPGIVNYIHPTTTIDDVSPSATVITATGVAINANVPF